VTKLVQNKRESIQRAKVDETNKYPSRPEMKPTQSMSQFILSGEIRILTPNEYHRMIRAIPKDEYKLIFKILLITGMRFVELQRLYDHPEWYTYIDNDGELRNHIVLPASAQLKVKQKHKKRVIVPLPAEFNDTFRLFLHGPRPPTKQSWNENMQRWAMLAGINPYGMSSKTTRKTLESWCLNADVDMQRFCLRQGHTSIVSLNHYTGLAFSSNEIREIKEILTSWGFKV
jgi:integrase